MRHFNQLSNKDTAINKESGLSVIQFRTNRDCQL